VKGWAALFIKCIRGTSQHTLPLLKVNRARAWTGGGGLKGADSPGELGWTHAALFLNFLRRHSIMRWLLICVIRPITIRAALFFFCRREFFMTLDALFTDFLVALLAKVHPLSSHVLFTDPSTYDREPAANLNLLLFI
jgi:hypothetical protein